MHLSRFIIALSYVVSSVLGVPVADKERLPKGDMAALRKMARQQNWYPVDVNTLPFEGLKRRYLDNAEDRRRLCGECMATVLRLVCMDNIFSPRSLFSQKNFEK